MFRANIALKLKPPASKITKARWAGCIFFVIARSEICDHCPEQSEGVAIFSFYNLYIARTQRSRLRVKIALENNCIRSSPVVKTTGYGKH